MEEIEEQPRTLNEIIAELMELSKRACPAPWYCGEEYEGDYEQKYCSVGDYSLEDKIDKTSYYEETIADFWGGDERDAVANAKYAIAAVSAVPLLIARIRELEQKSSTGLSDDIEAALKALEKWRKQPS
jgi:hypothetical protein